jgi:hypothetical protein
MGSHHAASRRLLCNCSGLRRGGRLDREFLAALKEHASKVQITEESLATANFKLVVPKE